MEDNEMSLRELYRSIELPGENPLKDAHEKLNSAVREAYGMRKEENPLSFLLALNDHMAQHEASVQPVMGPGLPLVVKDPSEFATTDCVGM